MSRPDRNFVSALALAVALSAPAVAQSPLGDVQSPGDLPEGIRNQLPQLAEACSAAADAATDAAADAATDAPAALPAGLDCAQVTRLAEMLGDGMLGDGAPAETPPETPPEAPAETATETPAEEAPQTAGDSADADAPGDTSEDSPDIPAGDVAGQTEAERPPAERPPVDSAQDPASADQIQNQPPGQNPVEDGAVGEAPGAGTPAEGTPPDQSAAEQAPAQGNAADGAPGQSQPEVPATTEAPETPAATPAAREAVRQAQEDPAPADSQAQADALAEEAETLPAAAAASGDGEAEVVEETVAEDAVRQSSQEFGTAIGALADQLGQPTNETAETAVGEDGDDNRLRNAALLGLGAIALSQILDGDDRVVSNSGDRVVIEQDGRLRVLRNDDVLLRRPGAEVQTYNYQDGSRRTVVSYEDGTQVETIRGADGRVLRRTRILQDGREVVLFDDTRQVANVEIDDLPQVGDRRTIRFEDVDRDRLAEALAAQEAQGIDRAFSLNQIRNIDRVRQLVPEISVGSINFQTGSAAIRAAEAEELSALGRAMARMIEENPSEVFLIEGHTDAVGDAAYNLALSDRRAESVALALTEYFDVPPANMVLQGYGESDLMVPTTDAERANRRAAVRRITPLLTTASR